jgi:hypothetical protein
VDPNLGPAVGSVAMHAGGQRVKWVGAINFLPAAKFMSFVSVCIALHLAVTLFLTGLIWTIQLVHYPLMIYVEEDRFIDFEAAHCRQIGLLVAPSMIAEGTLAIALCIVARSPWEFTMCALGSLLLLGIWLSTFLIQVPIHNQLASGRSIDLIQRLVRTNWIRTVAWSGRSLVAIAICLHSLNAAAVTHP